ncbi:MAG: hypothetical protein IKU14_02245, partial [Rhodocyclaceae bacterium]|nr:hypothetical protein [Rhodocyclaceae bacterium]
NIRETGDERIIRIVTRCPVTNQGVERAEGWLGNTNDVYECAHGAYDTEAEARAAIFAKTRKPETSTAKRAKLAAGFQANTNKLFSYTLLHLFDCFCVALNSKNCIMSPIRKHC